MRVALYARCSTADQSVDLQLDGLHEYVERRGMEIVDEYVDQGVSGAKAKRPELDRLLADAHRRRFDAVLVWKLDRLGRSLSHLSRIVEQLGSLDVDLGCGGGVRARPDQGAHQGGDRRCKAPW